MESEIDEQKKQQQQNGIPIRLNFFKQIPILYNLMQELTKKNEQVERVKK